LPGENSEEVQHQNWPAILPSVLL